MSKGRIIVWIITIAIFTVMTLFIHEVFFGETDWSTSFRGVPGTVYVREAEDGTMHRYEEGENGELYEINDSGERITSDTENSTNAVDANNVE